MIGLVISCVIYGIFIFLTYHKTLRVGNIFNILGIITADIAMVSYLASITSDDWIIPLVGVFIQLVFGLYFCHLVSVVSKKMKAYRLEKGYRISTKPKKKLVAILLAFFLGSIGGHKFYLDRKGQGAMYAMFSFTFIPLIVGIIEVSRYILMSQDEFNDRYNNSYIPTPQLRKTKQEEKRISKEPILKKETFVKPLPQPEVHTIDIPINIGKAIVEKESSGKFKIKVVNNAGKEFEFTSSGNMIDTYKVSGGLENKYGEV